MNNIEEALARHHLESKDSGWKEVSSDSIPSHQPKAKDQSQGAPQQQQQQKQKQQAQQRKQQQKMAYTPQHGGFFTPTRPEELLPLPKLHKVVEFADCALAGHSAEEMRLILERDGVMPSAYVSSEISATPMPNPEQYQNINRQSVGY